MAFRPRLPLGFEGAGDRPSSQAKFSSQVLQPSSPAQFFRKFARRRGALARHPSTFDEQRRAPLTITAKPPM
jgi:hypothetical protein